jgi:hypothetical protein
VSFRDLVKHVEENVFHDTHYFAETVTLRTEQGTQIETEAHCMFAQREEDGQVIETLTVSLLKTALPAAPDHGLRLYRADDDRAFLFRHVGTDTPNRWRAVFERRTQKRQKARAAA